MSRTMADLWAQNRAVTSGIATYLMIGLVVIIAVVVGLSVI